MGLFKSIGSMLNNITGATSAAQLNNRYQKEFAQNAHQYETEDLEKAGLNRILSVNGGGASASGGGTSGIGNMGITDIANSAAGIAKIIKDIELQDNTKELQDSQKQLNEVNATNAAAEGGWINKKAEAQISEAYSKMAVNSAKKEEAIQNAIYQKERSRGYKQSVSTETHGATFGGSSTITREGNQDVITKDPVKNSYNRRKNRNSAKGYI